jgi:hypothetical protein
MQKKKKNIDGFSEKFSKYRNDKLTDNERNSFERDLQKDPFAGEAEEGLNTITREELERDIASLKEALIKRSSQNNRMFLLRIAAVVVVLVLSGALIIYLNRNTVRSERMAINSSAPEVKVTQPAPGKSVASPVIPTEKHTLSEQQAGTSASGGTTSVKKMYENNYAKPEIQRQPLKPGEEKSQKSVSAEPQDARVASIETIADKTDERVKGDSILKDSKSTEMKMARAAAGDRHEILFEKEANSSAAIIPVNNSEKYKDTDGSGGTDPQPLAGMAAFNRYIMANIHLPEEMKPGNTETVMLGFIVDSVSVIKEIKIIESPGKKYSDEAIRLLKNGPAWKSATVDNKAVSKQVKLRIDFIK